MRKQQQVAVLIGLVIVMAAVYARAFRGTGHHRPAPSAAVPGDAAGAGAPVEESWPDRSAQRQAQQAEAVQLAWARDPFTHGGTSAGGPSGLALSGILWDANAPLAIINGQTLRVGEELEGFRVVQIDPDRVVLSDGIETFSLATTP